MIKIKMLRKIHLLLIFVFILAILSVLIFLLFFRQERISIEIVEFSNTTNQTFLQDLFKSFNLDFYPLYIEGYVVDYGIGSNKTTWKRAYISIFVFDDSNKTKNFLDFTNNYTKNQVYSGNLSVFLLKNNKIMTVNFYENKYINYVIEYFKNR